MTDRCNRTRGALRIAALTLLLPLAVSIAAVAEPATLHLELTRSSPEADAVLSESPEEVRLWFTEATELAISKVAVEGPSGEVELGDLERSEDGKQLHAAVPEPLEPGAYTVSWRTSSADGHPVRGEFGFAVKASR